MMRAIVLLIIILAAVVIWYFLTQARDEWRLHRGSNDSSNKKPAIETPSIALDMDNENWQCTCMMLGSRICEVRVEHPSEGIWHTWEINVHGPYAERKLQKALLSGNELCQHLNKGEGEPDPNDFDFDLDESQEVENDGSDDDTIDDEEIDDDNNKSI